MKIFFASIPHGLSQVCRILCNICRNASWMTIRYELLSQRRTQHLMVFLSSKMLYYCTKCIVCAQTQFRKYNNLWANFGSQMPFNGTKLASKIPEIHELAPEMLKLVSHVLVAKPFWPPFFGFQTFCFLAPSFYPTPSTKGFLNAMRTKTLLTLIYLKLSS